MCLVSKFEVQQPLLFRSHCTLKSYDKIIWYHLLDFGVSQPIKQERANL